MTPDPKPSSVRPLLIVAAAIGIFFLPVLFSHYTLIPQNPGDTLTGVAAEQLGYHAADPSGSFTELSYGGFLKQTLRSGHIPFWSPYQALGHPFLADTVFAALFSPSTLLRFLLPSAQWGIICVLNVLAGAISIYFLCLAYGCTRHGAVIGSITYVAVGTTVLYVCVFSVTSVATWTPLFILGIERLVSLPAGNRKTDYACAIAGAYGVVTGGHPTITVLALLLGVIYSATRLIQLRSPAAAGRLALAGAAAVLLTAVHWLPFVEYATYRGNTFGDYSSERYFLHDLPDFFLPYVYGHLNYPLTETKPPVEIGLCWSLGWLPPGVLPLFLAGIISLIPRRMWKSGACALALTVALMALWAFRVPPFHLFSQLPFMNRARGSYVPLTTGLFLCVISGLGFSRIEEAGIRLRTLAAWTLGVLAAAIAGCGALLLSHQVVGAETARYLFAHSGYSLLWGAASLLTITIAIRKPPVFFATGIGLALLSAIAFFPWATDAAISRAHETALGCFVIGFGIALAMAYLKGGKWPGFAIGAMAVAALVSRLAVMAVPHHLPTKRDLFQATAYTEFLQHKTGPEYRVYGLDGYLFPDLDSAFKISSANWVSALVTLQIERFYQRYLDAFQPIEQFEGLDRAGPGKGPMAEFNRNRRFWDYLGVRYVVSANGPSKNVGTGVAVYRKGIWYFTDSPDAFAFGNAGDLPIVSDWNGDGSPKVGVFRDGLWVPDWTGGRKSTGGDHTFHFGMAGDVPVTGDWNGGGRLKAGAFRKGLWLVDWNGDRDWNATNEHHTFWFGQAGDLPITGDWNGDGRSKAGIFRNGLWLLDWDGRHETGSPSTVQHSFHFGLPGDIPIMGDWNGDGRVKAGVFRNGQWLLDWNGNQQWDATDAAHAFLFGVAGDIPFVWPRKHAGKPSTPLTSAFEDRATHAVVLENSDAQVRAYLAPKTEIAQDWRQAQDRFGREADLRKTAFVEPGAVCASSEVSGEEMGRISGMRFEANSVELDVEARHSGMLVLVDAYMPGWTARVDGRPNPVVRVNGTFRGTCIEQAGSHRVVMEYQPPHWVLAAGLDGAGILMILVLCFWRSPTKSLRPSH